MWHVRTLDALVGEYDCEQDTADEVPGLEYSSGEDSDMDMGEEYVEVALGQIADVEMAGSEKDTARRRGGPSRAARQAPAARGWALRAGLRAPRPFRGPEGLA